MSEISNPENTPDTSVEPIAETAPTEPVPGAPASPAPPSEPRPKKRLLIWGGAVAGTLVAAGAVAAGITFIAHDHDHGRWGDESGHGRWGDESGHGRWGDESGHDNSNGKSRGNIPNGPDGTGRPGHLPGVPSADGSNVPSAGADGVITYTLPDGRTVTISPPSSGPATTTVPAPLGN